MIFWILVGVALGLMGAGLIGLSVLAFFSWQRKVVDAVARGARATL